MGSGGSKLQQPPSVPCCRDPLKPPPPPPTPPATLRSRLASIAHSSSKRLARINFKRKDSSREQTRAFAELISRWPIAHVEALAKEFEANHVLSILADEADNARPHAPKFGEQLLADEAGKDLLLTYRGSSAHVHGFLAILRIRKLPEILGWKGEFEYGCWEGETTLPPVLALDDLVPPSTRSHHLAEFVHWLYTDEWRLEQSVLKDIRAALGCTLALNTTMLGTHLRDQQLQKGDVIINLWRDSTEGLKGDYEMEARVRSALFSARSNVIRKLLAPREGEVVEEGSPRHLVLDETLLPRAFFPLIVEFLYTDKMEMKRIRSEPPVTSSLSEARAIVAGQEPNACLHRAANLVHVARFLGLHRLAELCEDVLASELTPTTAVPMLAWAVDGGSPWLARKARGVILKEFGRMLQSGVAHELPPSEMASLARSQYAQATEVDILEGALKWGEHELLRQLEAAEPNVVADTVHSVSRRGLKRSELESKQLRDIVAEVAAAVRVDYVLPPFHQSLTTGYNRGILERAPLQDLVCPATAEIDPDLQWYAATESSPGPRFYLPYYQIIQDVLARARERSEGKGEKEKEKEKEDASSSLPSTPSMATSSPLKSPGGGRWKGSRKGKKGVVAPPPPSPRRLPLMEDIVVENALPELLDEDVFEKARSSILSTLSEECTRHDLDAVLRREWHRREAGRLVASRIVRQLDLPEGCIDVVLRGDREKEEEEAGPAPCPTPPDLLP